MAKEDELGKEIEDFLDETPAEGEVEPKPATEPEPTVKDPEPVVEPIVEPKVDPEPIVKDPEPEPEPIVEPVVEPKPVVEPEPVKEPVVEPVVEPVPEVLTEREKLLIQRVEDVTGKTLTIDEIMGGEAIPKAEPVPVVDPIVEPKPVPKVVNFLGDEKLDDVLDSPEKFNSVLAKVYEQGVADAEQGAVEKVLKSIPQLVTSYVGKHAAMSELVGDFYKANQDLVGVKKTVAAVANEIAAGDPGMTVDAVFKKAAVRTREVLGLKAVAAQAGPTLPPPPGGPVPPVVDPKNPTKLEPSPAFADQAGRKGVATSGLKGLQKDVNDLIS